MIMDISIQHIDKITSSFKDAKTQATRFKRPGIKLKPLGIVLHSTANLKSTAQNERDNIARPNNTRWASFHYVVDDKQAIECIPPNEVAYHGGMRYANMNLIGIEICESTDPKKQAAIFDNAVKLVAQVLINNNLKVTDLSLHRQHDKTQSCPRILPDAKVQWFYNRVQATINNYQEGVKHMDIKEISRELRFNSDAKTNEKWNLWDDAIKLGITTGERPKGIITREETATMLVRMYRKLHQDVEEMLLKSNDDLEKEIIQSLKL